MMLLPHWFSSCCESRWLHLLSVVLCVQSAVSVRCVTVLRSDVVELMDVELLLLFSRSGSLRLGLLRGIVGESA